VPPTLDVRRGVGHKDKRGRVEAPKKCGGEQERHGEEGLPTSSDAQTVRIVWAPVRLPTQHRIDATAKMWKPLNICLLHERRPNAQTMQGPAWCGALPVVRLRALTQLVSVF
jgi:hypothetical protein